jgi:O-acetylserine/cysteine efflux transporter
MMQGRDLLVLMSVMGIWGFNFSMIKLGVSELDPLLIAAARFFFATFPLIFFVRKPNVPWRYLLGYGFVFGTGVWGMASCSITFGLSSGMASVLLQTDVLTTVLVGVLLYKEVISQRIAIGIMISLIGLVISMMYTNGNMTLTGVIFIMISAICWPLAGVIVRQSGSRSAFAFNIWGMLFAPIPLVVLSVSLHGVDVIATTYEQWTSDAWISVLFQAYPTTVFGYWIWNNMVIKYPMSMLAPLTLLVSVFALLSGYLIYGEQLSLVQWISCSTFLVGIGVVLFPESRSRKRDLVTDV